MAENVEISLVPGTDLTEPVVFHISCDPEFAGHDAEFELVAEVKVLDKRAVNHESLLYRQYFKIGRVSKTITVPRSRIRAYSYSGKQIEINIHTRLRIDDSILFDTKISREQQISIGVKPPVKTDAKSQIDPEDVFDFFGNLRAIPPKNQLITLTLAVAGGAVMLVNALIGLHDQFVPESMTWMYSHVDSDGDGQSPAMNALAGSGVLGVAVWYAMRKQLRKYMQFGLRVINMPTRIRADGVYEVSKFFHGKSRVPLENVTLRIVACNMEKGQYVRGSGTNKRTISFAEPVRGVLLYEKRVARIPAKTPIRQFFNERISFRPMFEVLYPPYMASATHGIDVHWEVQLLHPEFVDQELIGPTKFFEFKDFLTG